MGKVEKYIKGGSEEGNGFCDLLLDIYLADGTDHLLFVLFSKDRQGCPD